LQFEEDYRQPGFVCSRREERPKLYADVVEEYQDAIQCVNVFLSEDPLLIVLFRFSVILLTQPMAVLLNLWTALLLGILYLFFNAFPITFMGKHGL
jgi:hypothetical protein